MHIVASKNIMWPQREMFSAFSSCCRNLCIKAISVKKILTLRYFLSQLMITDRFYFIYREKKFTSNFVVILNVILLE